MFLNIYSKESCISDIEYYPSDNSNTSFHILAEILYLLFLYDFLNIFPTVSNA